MTIGALLTTLFVALIIVFLAGAFWVGCPRDDEP